MTTAKQDHREHVFLVIAAVAAAATVLVWVTSHSVLLLLIMRWLVLLTLVTYAAFKRTLTAWIFVAMLLGAEIGHDFPNAATHLRVLALIFLRLIKTIIAPLLFATLVVGIAGHSNLRQVGRLGLRSIIFFEIVTTLAIFLGLAAINLSKAGVGVQLPTSAATSETGVAKLSAEDTILHVFPENIAKAVADNAVLQVVVFSLIFAIALAMISEPKRRAMLAFCESLAETMFKFTNIVMLFAPIGVGAAVAVHRGTHWSRHARQPSEAAGHLVCRVGGLRVCSTSAHRAVVPGSAQALCTGCGRTGDHRIRHRKLRGCAAERHGSDGSDRRPAANRCFRHPHWLQLQPDRKLALFVGRCDLRGSGCAACICR